MPWFLQPLFIAALIFMSGCSTQEIVDSDFSGNEGSNIQKLLETFVSSGKTPLTITLEEIKTGRISSYRAGITPERTEYLFSQESWEKANTEPPSSWFTLVLTNTEGEKFEVSSENGIVKYTSTAGESSLFTCSSLDLFTDLRFEFDSKEVSPKNISVGDYGTAETIGNCWVETYRAYLTGTIPGGANEMRDIKILSVDVADETGNSFLLSFNIAVNPVNETGKSWKAGSGYDGEGELEGYIIVSRAIKLERDNERWYCREILGS